MIAFEGEISMKKVVLVLAIFFGVFVTGAERVKISFPKPKSPKETPKSASKHHKLSGSDGSISSSPKRPVSSMDQLKGELQKVKDDKKQLEEK